MYVDTKNYYDVDREKYKKDRKRTLLRKNVTVTWSYSVALFSYINNIKSIWGAFLVLTWMPEADIHTDGKI